MFASSISLLTTSLLLITVRIHYTFDNPYIAVLTTIFGMRTFYKFFVFNSHLILEHVLHTIDVFIFASLLGNGVMRTDSRNLRIRPEYDNRSFHFLSCGRTALGVQESLY